MLVHRRSKAEGHLSGGLVVPCKVKGVDDMNTGTITTLGFVFLIFLILSAANRTISRVMGLAGICILAVIFLQARSGVNLVDFSNIGDSITDLGFKIAAWAEDKLWPSINELARWLETNFL